MANPNRQNKPDIELSEQTLFNQSFDREFNVLVAEMVGLNSANNTMDRITTTGGKMNVNVSSGLLPYDFDYISRTLTNPTTETYTYKSGGSSGTTVATVTVVYTDSTLQTVSTVTRT